MAFSEIDQIGAKAVSGMNLTDRRSRSSLFPSVAPVIRIQREGIGAEATVDGRARCLAALLLFTRLARIPSNDSTVRCLGWVHPLPCHVHHASPRRTA